VKAGDARLIGGMFGVILSLTRNGQTVFSNQASAQGDIPVVGLNGVFTLPKTAPLVITLGARVFWDNTARQINLTSAGNTFVGYAYTAGGSTDTTIQVRLQTA